MVVRAVKNYKRRQPNQNNTNYKLKSLQNQFNYFVEISQNRSTYSNRPAHTPFHNVCKISLATFSLGEIDLSPKCRQRDTYKYLMADCHTQHQSTSLQKGNVKVFPLTCKLTIIYQAMSFRNILNPHNKKQQACNSLTNTPKHKKVTENLLTRK